MNTRRIPCLLLAFGLAFSPLFAAEPPKYSFVKPPLEVLDALAKADIGKVPMPSDAERKLLATVWDAKAKNPSAEVRLTDDQLVDLMLFASGTSDPDERKKYRDKLADLRAEVGKKLDGVKGTNDRGEVLLKTVHESVMKNGYESGQSSLTAVFDGGKQNCVSSAALVYLVGKGHGFDLRPMGITGGTFCSGHAYLDLVDAKDRLLVETTNPDGFDAETKLKKPGVFVIGGKTDRSKAREVDAVGLAAMIYSNYGVAEGKSEAGDDLTAARHYLCALALDPTSPTATNNLKSVLVNGGPKRLKAKQYEEAVKLYEVALTVAPTDDKVRNNAHVTWAEYLVETIAAKKDKEAVGLVARARKALPKDDTFKTAAVWFERAGQKEASWEAGIAVLDRGLAVVPNGEKAELRKTRAGFSRQWSQSCLDKSDYAGSLKALADAYAFDPTDTNVHAGIGYHTQEALAALGKKSVADAVAHYAELTKSFPDVKSVREMGATFARRAVQQMGKAGEFENALAAVDEMKSILTLQGKRDELCGDVYDQWASKLVADKQWEKALGKYTEGLNKYPKHGRLGHNAIATVDDWARTAMDSNDWDEAIRVYEVGLKVFPDNGHLKHNKQYCESKRGQKTAKK